MGKMNLSVAPSAACDDEHDSLVHWPTMAASLGYLPPKQERSRYRHSDFVAGTLNLLASVLRAIECVSTPDCILGCCITVLSTYLHWNFAPDLAVSMSWQIVSLAIIFPISQGISMGFKRRDQALAEFGIFLGDLRAIYGAVHTWKVKKADGQWTRMIDNFDGGEERCAAVRKQLRALSHELLVSTCVYFDAKRWGRSRMVIGDHYSVLRWCGADEQLMLIQLAREQRLLVESNLSRLQRMIQDFKCSAQLPGGEAHRLDSYVSKMFVAYERLAQFKEYRTPQAFRAFARTYILCVGALYGPYYVRLGRGLSPGSDPQDNIGISMVFALSVQLALSGLFFVMLGLEDPFARRGGRGRTDSVHVPALCEQARRSLIRIEREAEIAWHENTERESWGEVRLRAI